MAALGDVAPLLVEHLCARDVFALWRAGALAAPDASVVAALCARMRLRTFGRYTMMALYCKMRSTQRCFVCARPSAAVSATAEGARVLCASCGETMLVSRRQMEAGLAQLARRERGKARRELWCLPIARRTRTGALMYWRDDYARALRGRGASPPP